VGRQKTWAQLKYYDKKTGKIMRKEEGFSQEESEKQYFLFIKDLAGHLRKLKWFDFKCVVYNAFDECQPVGERFEKMKRFNTKIKEILPDVPRTFAMNTFSPKDFKGYVDIWIPVIERITKEQIKEIKNRGEDVWWYTMGYPQWPDYHINQDGVDHMVIPWLNWKFGVTGVLRWTVNSWPYRKLPKEKKPVLGKLWPATPWIKKNKSYPSAYLFYPGPDGAPWPSMRLEILRNSFENYEYFKLLSDIVNENNGIPQEQMEEARKLLQIPDKLVKDQGHYSRKAEDYIKYREKIGEMIEKLKKSR
jgi:hypothetical protein